MRLKDSSIESRQGSQVEFRAPWRHRISNAVALGLVIFIVLSSSVLLAWANLQGYIQVTWKWLPALLIAATLIAWLIAYSIGGTGSSRLILTEAAIVSDSLCRRRRIIPYERVSLILHEILDSGNGALKFMVTIRPSAGRDLLIYLTADDAATCHEALRTLCPQAAAIDGVEGVHAPLESTQSRVGMQAAIQEVRRQARNCLLTSGICALLALWIGSGLWQYHSGAVSPGHAGPGGSGLSFLIEFWILFAGTALGAVWSVVRWRCYRRFAVQLQGDVDYA